MFPRTSTVGAVVIAGAVLACSAAPQQASPRGDGVSAMAEITGARAELEKAWERLDRLRRELDRPASGSQPTPTASAQDSPQDVSMRRVEAAFEAAYSTDQAALTEFLKGALRARPRDPDTLAALDLYADSAIRYAGDLIDRSGDYRRAIELLDTARAYFGTANVPVPQRLADAERHARERRFIGKAAFAKLARGMTATQVRALLGVPFSANVRQSDVGGHRVTSWLYVGEGNEVTALYFDDRATLYAWRWDVRGGE